MPSGIPLYEDYGDIEQWVKACTSHPEFRVLPSTGDLSMSQVNTELGRAATAPISLQSAGVRNLTVSSRAYNTPIAMSQLRGATALITPTRGLCTIDPLALVEPSNSSSWSYNYRTGVMQIYVNTIPAGVRVFKGVPVGDMSGYNTEGLVITDAVMRMTTDFSGNTYDLPCTQYPTFQNDWTGLFTFAPSSTASYYQPLAIGGLKIGIP